MMEFDGIDCTSVIREHPSGVAFMMSLEDLTPSQLYISQGKLNAVQEWLDIGNLYEIDPIPVKRLGDRIVMMDGHTRAVATHLAGLVAIPVYWDEDELDMCAYGICVDWCKSEGILSPIDLASRVVSHEDYQHLWLKRCAEIF